MVTNRRAKYPNFYGALAEMDVGFDTGGKGVD
jgi:hypothetical protein